MSQAKTKILTKDEAIEAMKRGEKVRHRYFSDGEWMMSNRHGNPYRFEDKVIVFADEFWATHQHECF